MSSVTKVDGSKCVNACAGALCSGPVYLKVFNTTGSIKGLSVKAPSVGFVMQDVPFSSSVVQGNSTSNSWKGEGSSKP